MKIFWYALNLVLGAFVSFAVYAQEEVPTVKEKLKGAHTLNLKIGFDLLCETSIRMKKKRDFFPSTEKSSLLFRTYRDGGGSFLSFEINEGGGTMRVKVPLAASGIPLEGIEPVFESDVSLSSEDMTALRRVLSLYKAGISTESHYGKEFAQDTVVPIGDLCKTAGVQRFGVPKGGYRAEGIAEIKGREAFILTVSKEDKCTMQGKVGTFSQAGWLAVDVESGLFLAQSLTNSALLNDEPYADEKITMNCSIERNSSY